MKSEPETILPSFAGAMKAVVIGASGGIGAALVARLGHDPAIRAIAACRRRGSTEAVGKSRPFHVDLEDEATITAAATAIGDALGDLDLVIVATGMLHGADGLQPEKTWRALDAERLAQIYRVNAIGPALVAKHFLPLLARDRKSVLAALAARVGSIGDNELGGWHAYRASKAALNMLIKNFSIELQRRNPSALVVGLHPGTVNTSLSKPFQGHVPEGKLFTAAYAAERLLGVIDGLRPEDSGRQFAWDGAVIQH